MKLGRTNYKKGGTSAAHNLTGQSSSILFYPLCLVRYYVDEENSIIKLFYLIQFSIFFKKRVPIAWKKPLFPILIKMDLTYYNFITSLFPLLHRILYDNRINK